MSNQVAKIKLNKVQLAEALMLPPQAQVLAAMVLDSELVLFIEHLGLPKGSVSMSSPEYTLDDLRKLGTDV